MSLNSLLIFVGIGALLFFTNPSHNRHREVLSPVFLQHVNSLSNRSPDQKDDWTFLPAMLDYANYYLFSTTRFPGEVATEDTPAEGYLTFGALGSIFVLFPKSPESQP